ncbi:hypothetical protein V2S66_15290 [Streptomyces sp. V4-01]|uniref:DUF2637 domain-containing protein n=1 Tax=Actinacidiphila polyblastidii TaxID=3110430 RepID=A0ABU7PC00_9ACTN|nr:hypothetical protein [Streptomyces sp. V4-01]
MYEYDDRGLLVPTPFFEPEPDETRRQQWDLDAEFEQFFRPPYQEEPPPEDFQPPPAPAPLPERAPRVDRRRRRTRLIRVQVRWPAVLGHGIAGVTATVTGTVSVLAGMISYGPLRLLASPTANGLASTWPLLVYGPWVAACLSILHAARHRKHVRAAWCAVIVFTGICMALCIAHAPKTVTAIATAGLPPVSALACFHLLFRQLTLLQPRHAKLPRQRRR